MPGSLVENAQELHSLLKVDIGDRIAVYGRDDHLRTGLRLRQESRSRDDKKPDAQERRDLRQKVARRVAVTHRAFLLAEPISCGMGIFMDSANRAAVTGYHREKRRSGPSA